MKHLLIALLISACSVVEEPDPYGLWRGDYAGAEMSLIIAENNPGRIVGVWGGVGFSGEVSFDETDIMVRFLSNLRATTLYGTWEDNTMELWSPDCGPCVLVRDP